MNITITLSSIAEIAELRQLLNQLPDKLEVDTSASLDSLDLTIRTSNCLKAEAVETIGQLLTLSANDLLKIPNLGRLSLMEIRTKLGALGLRLKGDK